VGLVSRGFRAGARGERLVRWKAGRNTDIRLGATAGIRITLKRDNHLAQEYRREQALTGARLIISHR